MMKKIIIIPLLFLSFISFSQDIHFSQFMNSSFLYNPGNTGMINGDHRFLLDYRTQWGSIAKPYDTYAFTYDTKVFKKMTNNTKMGIGIGAYKDVAGDTEFGTTAILLSSSAMMKLDDFNSLSVGLQGGIMQNSINNNMRWGNQYDGDGYNALMPSYETGTFNSTPFVGDFNAGVVWNYGAASQTVMTNDMFSAQIGLSVSHLSRQKIKITNYNESIYNRITLHGKSFISIQNTPFAVIPGFMWQKQGPSSELVLGTYMRTKLKTESRYTGFFKESAMAFGLFYRLGDAFIPKVTLEIFNFNLGISYDITVGGLSGAGGLEISLQYFIPSEMRYGKGTTPKMY